MIPLLGAETTYPLVDTQQTKAYDAVNEIRTPGKRDDFYGQDANYDGKAPDYKILKDGTVQDRVTGLMWTQTPLEDRSYTQALTDAEACRVGGHADWRLPTVKELYSLIRFDGTDPDPQGTDTSPLRPFIDAEVFDFRYGDPSRGERIIDAQYVSATLYTGVTMGGHKTVFGVNFADGRIKGYPIQTRRGAKTFRVLFVRGNPAYGKNRFEENPDGTVTDHATGLIWMKTDSGKGMDWAAALEYAENLEYAGHADWRLPNAKELQSIVDYSRSPDFTGSPAIDPVFEVTEIKNEAGGLDYPSYWTGTSHARGRGASAAVYISFGRALGFMAQTFRPGGPGVLLDVHGAGAQRSDPKSGDPARYPRGRGPQGDVIRIYNFVRCVRGGS